MSCPLTDLMLIPMIMLPDGPMGPRGPVILPALPWALPMIRAVPPPMTRLLAIPTMATGRSILQSAFSTDRLTVGLPNGLRLPPLVHLPRPPGRGLFPTALLAVGIPALVAPVHMQVMLLTVVTPNPVAMLPLAVALAILTCPVLRERHLLL